MNHCLFRRRAVCTVSIYSVTEAIFTFNVSLIYVIIRIIYVLYLNIGRAYTYIVRTQVLYNERLVFEIALFYIIIYHTSNKFPAFPLVKMTSRDCPIFYYIGSATKNMGLVKFKMAEAVKS